MTPIAKYFGDLFGANITLRWQGQGQRIYASLFTRWPDGSAGPEIDQAIDLGNSLTGPTEATFDLGPGRWPAPVSVDTLVDARIAIGNTAAQLLFDSGWQAEAYLVKAAAPVLPALPQPVVFTLSNWPPPDLVLTFGLQWTPTFDLNSLDWGEPMGASGWPLYVLAYQAASRPSSRTIADDWAMAMQNVWQAAGQPLVGPFVAILAAPNYAWALDASYWIRVWAPQRGQSLADAILQTMFGGV